jgi:hypothetical protein
MPSALERYLSRYGAVAAVPTLGRRYRYVLTIPAFDEPTDFLESVLASSDADGVVVVVTVNVPETADVAARERTADLYHALKAYPDVIVIDRVTDPIPRRQGVGLARKLAADLATALIHRGDVTCPVIFMTDADTMLPPGYFAAGSSLTTGTALYPFRHRSGEPGLQRKADTYELHLMHYVDGLGRAGSPYAFQTLGSTIAMHADTYARVRGIPRRNAAEDFYLLNKAAKVDPVIGLAAPEITIAARHSHRVPFGTGPALDAIPDDVEQFVSYPDEAFDELSQTLRAMTRWSLRGDPFRLPEAPFSRLSRLGWDPDRVGRAHAPGPRRLRACHEWFDGFRTMRFVRMAAQEMGEPRLLETLRSRHAQSRANVGELIDLMRRGRAARYVGIAEAIRNPPTNSV